MQVTGQLLERCVLYCIVLYCIVLYCLNAVYLERSQLRVLSRLTCLSFVICSLESKKRNT